MSDYPINLKAKNIHALVIGAGKVGLRKIETLLKQGAENITVIDNAIFPSDFKYNNDIRVNYSMRSYCANDLERHNLVFIASDKFELNSLIVKECKARNILCNVVTRPEEGSFTLPALVQKGNILLTLSTNALSPALSKALKDDIEDFLDLGYAELCAFLGALRPSILNLSLPLQENTRVFRFFVSSPQRELFLDYFKFKNDTNVNGQYLHDIHEVLAKNFDEKIKRVIMKTLENCNK